jgi:hypothetical protein
LGSADSAAALIRFTRLACSLRHLVVGNVLAICAGVLVPHRQACFGTRGRDGLAPYARHDVDPRRGQAPAKATTTLSAGVSLLVGMTGVGGGALMTPLLVLLFGIHPATAVGTDLLYAAATKSAGKLVHGLNRNIDWRIVGRLAAGSVPMTALPCPSRHASAFADA